MTKIIDFQNPDITKTEITYLSASINAGLGVLTVQSTADFSVNDIVVIEDVGNEKCEMQKILNVASISQLTLDNNVVFNHEIITPIRKSYYNQMRLYRSTDNVTYTLIDTKNIDWQDKYNKTTFVDNTGSDAYWYKVEYYNSYNLNSKMSDPIKTITQPGFITVDEFRDMTGIKGTDEALAKIIRTGAEALARRLYTFRIYQSTQVNTQHFLDVGVLELADTNFNLQIDKEDLLAYEADADGVRTYVTANITSVDKDRHLVLFNSVYPTNGKTLYIEYHLTFRKISEMQETWKRLNALYSANYFLKTVPITKMQRGIGSWTLNGVTINFDGGELRNVTAENEKEIANLINLLMRFYSRPTRIGRPPDRTSIRSLSRTAF